jgi:hypothetical protein
MLTWEVLYFTVLHDFMDRYGAYIVGKLRASGASAAAIQAQVEQMKKYKEMYENPLYNAAVTLLEPLPVGLVMTLLSAAILRKRRQSQPTQSPLPASF